MWLNFFFQSDEDGAKEKDGEEGQQKFIAHVPVPSQQEVRRHKIKSQRCTLAFARQILTYGRSPVKVSSVCYFCDLTLELFNPLANAVEVARIVVPSLYPFTPENFQSLHKYYINWKVLWYGQDNPDCLLRVYCAFLLVV